MFPRGCGQDTWESEREKRFWFYESMIVMMITICDHHHHKKDKQTMVPLSWPGLNPRSRNPMFMQTVWRRGWSSLGKRMAIMIMRILMMLILNDDDDDYYKDFDDANIK